MAPKRPRKSNVGVGGIEKKYQDISIDDVLCPICRSILIEPVTLPCSHDFCLACFNGTMENTALSCPLCRIRIGSWLRLARKGNKVINFVLWRIIQHKFPNEVDKILAGKDLEGTEKRTVRLADPGEIRREYEQQMAKEILEIQNEREAEAKASELAIRRILEEEKIVVKQEEEKIRIDEEMAKKLSTDLKNAGPSNSASVKTHKKTSLEKYFITLDKQKSESDLNYCSKLHPNQPQTIQKLSNKCHTSTILCQNRGKKHCSNAYKHLLISKTLQRERNNSNGSDSGDSIKQEMRYFKPIRPVPKTISKLNSDGNLKMVPLIKVPAIYSKRRNSTITRAPNTMLGIPNFGRSRMSAFASYRDVNEKETLVKNPAVILIQRPVTPVTISPSGKLVKQYYNKKRSIPDTSNSMRIPSLQSPLLGFEKGTASTSDFTKLTAVIQSLSENINGSSSNGFKNIVNNCHTRKNKKRVDDLKNSKKNNLSQEINKKMAERKRKAQEKLDREFALKLHEELNSNPRHKEYCMRPQTRPSTKVKTSPRRPQKRQTTLDELIHSKKFKI